MLDKPREDAPLDGFERGGYRLVYLDRPNAYQTGKESVFGTIDLIHSIGLSVSTNGELVEMLWDSPAFEAALLAGSTILCVNGADFESEALKKAVGAGDEMELSIATGRHRRDVTIRSPGHRYPYLQPIEGRRRRLDDILEPLGEDR